MLKTAVRRVAKESSGKEGSRPNTSDRIEAWRGGWLEAAGRAIVDVVEGEFKEVAGSAPFLRPGLNVIILAIDRIRERVLATVWLPSG